MNDSRTINAIESSDTDELIRIIDGHCDARAWEPLIELRTRCQEAITRGKQLWGVDEHIRYRLALHAPPEWAGPVLSEGPTRFTLGPLPEVAASTKTWDEMEPHLIPGPQRMTFAAERAVRGDQVGTEGNLPTLQSWEPSYPLATYKPDKVETPQPKLPARVHQLLPEDVVVIDDPDSENSLNDLVEPWVDQSNGRSQTVSVEGTAHHAIAALGVPVAYVAALDAKAALAQMAWAAASGGAHGSRRGTAAGRYLAWWVLAVLADLEWPANPDQLEDAASALDWYWFDDGAPEGGWALRLALEDRSLGISWAISAIDIAD